MLTEIKGPHQHFNAYYENNSIVIQFVIAEFVMTHQLGCQIKRLAYEGFQSIQCLGEAVRPLFQHLNQLLGSGPDHERLAISRWTKGPLTKLKDYCEQFSKNTENLNKRHLELYAYVHQAWLSALENLELLNSIQKSITIPLTQATFLNTKRALKHLDRCLSYISKQLPRVLSAYKDNENVLFFLLRKKDFLSEIYGSDFIYTIFKSFSRKSTFPQLIIKGYLKRGFENLLPTIQQNSWNQEPVCV